MKKQFRRKFSSAFKAKVALEAVKNQQTLAELAKKFDVVRTSDLLPRSWSVNTFVGHKRDH